MTDTNTDPGTNPQSGASPKVFKIPLKAGATIEILASELNSLDDDSYSEILTLGLKALLNRGMDKAVGAVKDLEGAKLDEAKANALAKAKENYESLKAGTIKKSSAKSDKVSREVNTEALRLARNIIKDAMRREKIKVSYVEAAEITKMAKAYLASNPELIEQAKASIAANDAKATASGDSLLSLVKAAPISAKKQKAAEAAAAKKKAEAQLSATQAGKTKPHTPAKGKSAPQATA